MFQLMFSSFMTPWQYDMVEDENTYTHCLKIIFIVMEIGDVNSHQMDESLNNSLHVMTNLKTSIALL